MTTHPALLDVIAQLESITAGPIYTIPAPQAAADELAPARRSHGEIVTIPPADRLAVPAGFPFQQIRTEATDFIDNYLARPQVTARALLNLPPGTGKTWQGVRAAHKAQMQGLKVGYIMPRHEFYGTLIEMSASQGYGSGYWHHWQPRQEADSSGQGETCHHTAAITQWIKKGHEAAKYCGGACGFPFMQNQCKYYKQEQTIKLRSHGGITPIVAIQHQHLTSGHTMIKDFDLIIGDESPLGAYPWIWHIPSPFLINPKLKTDKVPAAAFMAILDRTARTMAHDITIEGPALLDALGGADHVLATIRSTLFPDSTLSINQVESVESAPYDYLAIFCDVLISEAREAQAGADYIHRAILRPDGLHLLLRKDTTQDLPAKVIWLDATASPELYSAVTNWRIEVFTRRANLEGPIIQVTEGIFSKTSMVRNKKPSPQAHQTARIIEHIIDREEYANPLIVSYQDLGPLFAGRNFTHFHGNRGSNRFEACDSVFILGTPQPPAAQIELIGRMFYAHRTEPFNDLWCKKPIPYAGTDQGYMASGLWAEPELALILDQLREQEIVQSAHRIRPILSPKPIWLFTALPVADLPPTHLFSLLDALQVETEGVDAGTFLDALDIADTMIAEHGHCTTQHMIELLNVTAVTAYKYLAALAQYDPAAYAPMEVKTIGRGRPRRAIGRIS
jgi:hypothetical protein